MAKEPTQSTAVLGTASRGDHLLQQATAALEQNHPDDAAHVASEILRTSPQHAQALYVLGCVRLLQGRAAEAIAALEGALRSQRNAQIETMLGIALRTAGRREDALLRLTRATKRRPPYAAAFYELGCLLASMKRDDDAVEALSRGHTLAPMMPQISTELGYALLRRGRHAEAKACFLHTLQISPRLADAVLGMGEAHRELGEMDAAAACFKQVLASKPDDSNIWLQLGLCLQELGRNGDAQASLARAARGPRQNYDQVLNAFAASPQGRFWIKPSAAERFFRVAST